MTLGVDAAEVGRVNEVVAGVELREARRPALVAVVGATEPLDVAQEPRHRVRDVGEQPGVEVALAHPIVNSSMISRAKFSLGALLTFTPVSMRASIAGSWATPTRRSRKLLR